MHWVLGEANRDLHYELFMWSLHMLDLLLVLKSISFLQPSLAVPSLAPWHPACDM